MILVRFVIHLHLKDINLLKEIQSYFGVGNINYQNKNTTCVYSVGSISDLINVVFPHFEKYPLLTEKQADFEIFKEIVTMMSKKQHLSQEGLNKIISLKSSLNKRIEFNTLRFI